MSIGKVIELKGSKAIVEIKRQDMCGECHACDVVTEKKSCRIKCINACDSKIGDMVEIESENTSFLKATFIMYGLPLIALLVGLALGVGIGYKLSPGYKEGIMIVMGILLMNVTFFVIRNKEKNKKYETLLPRIINVIKKD